MTMKSNNLALLHRDRGYRFGEPGSLLYRARIAVNDAGLSSRVIADRIHRETGEVVKPRTIDNLMNGRTRTPHLRTVEFVMVALGYRLQWRR
jgi:hypothetical protein